MNPTTFTGLAARPALKTAGGTQCSANEGHNR
jgi:hypothetical protein